MVGLETGFPSPTETKLLANNMANSRFEYVRKFELDDSLLPSVYLVCRIDGRSFSTFVKQHGFRKPNDLRGLQLMNACAEHVMRQFGDIVLAYGVSDEFSFLLRRDSTLYNRRSSKIATAICSAFASAYVFHWSRFFPETSLAYPPAFDGRVVCYPTEAIARDYFAWRQVDCHINNLYNTAFWSLVQDAGLSPDQAEQQLMGTMSDYKNELLFQQFGVNYNDLPTIYRRGSIILRNIVEETIERSPGVFAQKRRRAFVTVHEDMTKDQFWSDHPDLLGFHPQQQQGRSGSSSPLSASGAHSPSKDSAFSLSSSVALSMPMSPVAASAASASATES